ncbi:MAG: hypothetical protein AAGE84_03685 [Cyanobacteria bacterium P01_G01_bin.39]
MFKIAVKEAKSVFYSYRNQINIALSHYPKLHSSVSVYLYGFSNSKLVNNQTDLVIEGFPGSANSFAVKAFQMAQNKEYKIAHHCHHPAQVISGIYRGIPTILLIRKPDDCILSYTVSSNANILSNGLNEGIIIDLLQQNLNKYINFYSTLYKYKDSCVIGLFDRVTQNFGEIVNSVNHKYNTDYDIFIHNDDNTNACFSELTKNFRNIFKNNSLEMSVRKPSLKRKELKQLVEPYLMSTSLHDLRAEAYEIYQSYRA